MKKSVRRNCIRSTKYNRWQLCEHLLFTVIAWVRTVSVVLESPNGEWDDVYLMRGNNLRINPIGGLET